MAKVTRGRGPRALAALLPRLAEPALRKRGFTEAALLTHWPDIVGPALAGDAMPDRLSFPRGSRSGAVLHVRVAGAAALELQHLAPQIVERINGFFGYAAVARLALVQGTVTPPPRRAGPVPATEVPAERVEAIASAAESIADETLRGAVTSLGRAVAARRRTDGGERH
jgi:hypothetical protein